MSLATLPVSTEAILPRKETQRPKLGFLGVGWIGLNRLEAIAKSGLAEIAALADPSREMVARARAIAPRTVVKKSVEELLDAELDGVVIATPSAIHAEQCLAAFHRGLAVFCQKPLGRNMEETQSVIEAARRANRLLGVDFSYRHLAGVKRLRELIRTGDLGHIYAVEMAFHNAYGPDKSWFYDRKLSGGGCVIDLGIHLVDLALWILNYPQILRVTSRLFAQGEPWRGQPDKVEDYAVAQLDLSPGTTLHLACSWKLPAGRDALIRACFYGTRGGAALQNVNGSFYEFVTERFEGTSRQTLTAGPEEWGGRAAVAWVQKLASSREFDPEIEQLRLVAGALDEVYAQRLR
jgi:predicted dehydrogenase